VRFDVMTSLGLAGGERSLSSSLSRWAAVLSLCHHTLTVRILGER
jgi:hypothetical protein